MECLSSLILLFAFLPTPTAAPVLLVLTLLIWQVKRLSPCLFCAVVMYAILVSVILYEDANGGGGLFDALRLSPEEMELNLLLRVKYDMALGLGRSQTGQTAVFAPEHFIKGFVRYLLEPNYGKIYRQ